MTSGQCFLRLRFQYRTLCQQNIHLKTAEKLHVVSVYSKFNITDLNPR